MKATFSELIYESYQYFTESTKGSKKDHKKKTTKKSGSKQSKQPKYSEDGKSVEDHYSKQNTVLGNAAEWADPTKVVASGVRGYELGKKVGHPVAGTLLGPEGAIGAASNTYDDVNLGSVYNSNELPRKILGYGLGGAAVGTGLALMGHPIQDLDDAINQANPVDDQSIFEKGYNSVKDFFAQDALQNDPKDAANIVGKSALLGGALGVGAGATIPAMRYAGGKLFSGDPYKARQLAGNDVNNRFYPYVERV